MSMSCPWIDCETMVCLEDVLCLLHVIWLRDNNVNIFGRSCGAKKDAAHAADDCPMDFALTEMASNSVAGLTDNYSAGRSEWVRVGLVRRLRLLDLSLESQEARVLAEASQRQEQEVEVDAEHSMSLLQQVSVREIVLSSETNLVDSGPHAA